MRYYIIAETDNIKYYIEPVFNSKEIAQKRLNELVNAVMFLHSNHTKYYIENV